MREYKYLLFDLDNTLMDFDRAEETAFYAAFSASDLVVDDHVYALYHEINAGLWKRLEKGELSRERLKDLRYEMLFQRLGIPDDGKSREVSDRYFTELSRQQFMMDGAEDVCRILRPRYKMYIVTNGTYEVQKGRFFGSPLEKYFDDIFVSEHIGAAKPSPVFFDHVVKTVGDEDRSAYCVIGDSLTSDIDGALAAGMDAIWLDHRGTGDAQGRAVTHILQDIRQLPAYLSDAEQGDEHE